MWGVPSPSEFQWLEHRIAPFRIESFRPTDPHRGEDVNKSELIDHIAKQADISKAAAARALEAVVGGVKATLKKSGSVAIAGFGTFTVSKRAARTGRNPRTGASIKIKSAKVPKFRPGKALKDHLN
jgi:DNA-binding protein HU-beta